MFISGLNNDFDLRTSFRAEPENPGWIESKSIDFLKRLCPPGREFLCSPCEWHEERLFPGRSLHLTPYQRLADLQRDKTTGEQSMVIRNWLSQFKLAIYTGGAISQHGLLRRV